MVLVGWILLISINQNIPKNDPIYFKQTEIKIRWINLKKISIQ